MAARARESLRILFALTCAFALVAGIFAIAPARAEAVTSAEKYAEVDAVLAQIDSLQSSLNEAEARYEAAVAERDAAIAARDEAQRQIEEETARIAELDEKLSAYVVGIYKQGNATFLDVILQATSFQDFINSLNDVNNVSREGAALIEEAKEARAAQEAARRSFEEQSQIAEEKMAEAEQAAAEIQATQDALRAQAQELSEEAAELQYQEELAAEEARRAEEARKAREEELAAAAAAAAEAEEAGVDYVPGDSVLMGSGYFTNPCPEAFNSSGFGYRTFDNSFHMGLDMAADEGTPFYAADSGTVIFATNDGGWNGGAGNWVVISHGNGIVTKYMHASATYVVPGDHVERGQNIGAVGETGQAYGAHLHFQVEVDGVAVNPLNYI